MASYKIPLGIIKKYAASLKLIVLLMLFYCLQRSEGATQRLKVKPQRVSGIPYQHCAKPQVASRGLSLLNSFG